MKKQYLLLTFFAGLMAMNSPLAKTQTYEEGFNQRAQKLIDYVADDYKWDASGWYDCNSPSDYGKYNWPIPVARFHKYGLSDADANKYLWRFDTLDGGICLANRFHFNLMGETYIFGKYWEASSVKATVKDYLTEAWNRDDSYNLFTVEGTENHIHMTKCAAYIYAQIALDSFPSDFPDAQERLDSAKSWVMWKSKQIYTGGTSEWNSAKYGAYNIVPWIALYESANDDDVYKAAKAVVDYYATEIALHYTQGITGGYESRNSRSFESVQDLNDYLGWLWFGNSPRKITFSDGSMDTRAAQSVYAAASNYRPPEIAVKLANKNFGDAMYYNSKSDYAFQDVSWVKQTFYIGEGYTLGASYLPYGGWTGADNEFMTWKLVANCTPDTNNTSTTANVAVGYGLKKWNKSRRKQPWDQLVHHKNVLVQMTKVPSDYSSITSTITNKINTWKTEWDNDFSSRFPSDSKANPINNRISQDIPDTNVTYVHVWDNNNVNSSSVSDVRYFELDSIYIAVRSLDNMAPAYEDNDSYHTISDQASSGNLTGVILDIGEKAEYTSLADFQTAINNNSSLTKDLTNDHFTYTTSSGEVLDVYYEESGSYIEPLYDWGYGPTTPQQFQTSPPFQQPTWPTGVGHGRLASWTVDGNTVDLSTDWAVFEGPFVQLKNHVLSLNDSSGNYYTVDYRGSVPIFSTEPLTTNDDLKNTSVSNKVDIYPNPADQYFNVVIDKKYNDELFTISLYNSKGQEVIKNTINGNKETIGTTNLNKGIYVVKVINNNNGGSFVRKIIIK